MATWEEWFQSQASKLVDTKTTQPYELQRLRLEALGDMGYYTEGQAGTLRAPGTVAGMTSGTLLLIGGALVLFMFMKD
jgi:hypothetical protein